MSTTRKYRPMRRQEIQSMIISGIQLPFQMFGYFLGIGILSATGRVYNIKDVTPECKHFKS